MGRMKNRDIISIIIGLMLFMASGVIAFKLLAVPDIMTGIVGMIFILLSVVLMWGIIRIIFTDEE